MYQLSLNGSCWRLMECVVFAGTKTLFNTRISRKMFCEGVYPQNLQLKSTVYLLLQCPCIVASNCSCKDQGLLQHHVVVPLNYETTATKRGYFYSQKRRNHYNVGSTISTAKECYTFSKINQHVYGYERDKGFVSHTNLCSKSKEK